MGCAAVAGAVGAAFATVGGAIAGAVGLSGATLAGVSAGALIGGGLEGTVIGAGLGAVEGAVTGEGAGKGALGGAITGGLTGGLSPALAGATGLSAPVAGGLVGAGAGALGSAATGQNPLIGGLTGAVGGYLSQSMGGTGGAAGNADLIGSNGQYILPPPDPNATIVSPTTGQLLAPGDPGYDAAVSQLQASASAPNTTGATGASPAAKSAGGITETSLALGALSALGSALAKPKQAPYGNTPGPAQVAANTGPLFNTGLNTNVPGRTPLNPYSAGVPTQATPGGYGVYGGPEQSYFGGNSLANFGFAKGGALRREREFRTGSGQHRVRGPGTEVSDSIPARLSTNEYVLDARDVRQIGGGDVEKGSRILDRARRPLQRGKGPLARLAGEAA